MKKFKLFFVLSLLLLFTTFRATAEGYRFIPYDGYDYNSEGSSVPSAVGYAPKEVFRSDAQESILFSKPSDLFIDSEGNFYILNGKPTSLVILDKTRKLRYNIETFTMMDGSTVNLVEPNGVFVHNSKIYIADSGLEMVLVSNYDGKVEMVLEKPESELYDQEVEFNPQKVLVDDMGNIYVIAKGIYQGALTYNSQGKFVEYFGSNRVELTASFLLRAFWRNFMTEEQIDNSIRNVPVEYTNFTIDKEGFIITCTISNSSGKDEIRKLSPSGLNIYPEQNYGDLERIIYKAQNFDSAFVDVAVNDDGFICGLDEIKGRLFLYDLDGSLIFISGGSGVQVGRFVRPVAIAAYGRDFYILDTETHSISVFSLTEYGQKVYDATMSYIDGKYLESRQLWEQVIRQNANYRPAYVGLGKAQYLMGDYNAAMNSFELGDNKKQLSQAFSELREQILRKYSGAAITVIAILIIGIGLYRRIRHIKPLKKERSN